MALPSLLPLGTFHLVYFGVMKPYWTWQGRDVWQVPPPPRARYYRRTSSHFLSCGFITLMTMASLGWFSSRAPIVTDIFVLGRLVEHPRDVWFGLLPREWTTLGSLALGAAAYVVMVAADLGYSRRCLARGAPHMYYSTPQTRRDRVVWVGVSVLAGVTEELTWRGVQPELIAQLAGTLWPAVIICAATFGFGHIRNGRPFTVIAGLFALGFHGLTLVTGSLYVAMIVHVAVNVTVGLRAGTWAARSAG